VIAVFMVSLHFLSVVSEAKAKPVKMPPASNFAAKRMRTLFPP
jgi:hypothetical protein